MLGTDYGNETEYAHTRITGTIVRLDGEPVYVTEPVGGRSFRVKVLDDEQGDRHTVALTALDVSPVPLGFVNFLNVASYLVRMPKRRDYKQGTRMENITSLHGFRVADIPMLHLAKTIRNNYPTFTAALRKVEAKAKLKKTKFHSIAWHRDWALRHDLAVIYRGGAIVGTISGGRPVLNEDKLYLRERLEEAL